MKRSKLASALAVMTLLQSVAHAQLDLPDPTQDTGGGSSTPTTHAQPSANTQAGSATIIGISRKTGGALYTLKLMQALGLERIDLRVSASKVKIYSMTLITENGQRIPVSQLSNTAQLDTGVLAQSESLNSAQKIVSIEVQAESFSAEANVIVTAVSSQGYPMMSLVATPAAPSVGDNTTTVTPTPGQTTDGAVTKPEDVRPTYPTTPVNPAGSTNPDIGGPLVLMPPGNVGGEFVPGELAILNNSQIVRVTNVYMNDVEYTIDGRTRHWAYKHELQKSTRCYGQICQGDTVTYANQYGQLQSGQVETAFANGTLVVMVGGASYVVAANLVNKAGGNGGSIGGGNNGGNNGSRQECTYDYKFCINDIVMYQNAYVGRVTAILGKDMVEVSLNGFDRAFTVYIDELAASINCTGPAPQLCIGTRTFYQGAVVTITGIFANGFSSVRIDGSSGEQVVLTSLLGRQYGADRPGQYQQPAFRVGQKVKFQGRTVTIKEIYANGQIRVSSGTLFGMDSIVDPNQLRKM